MTSGRICALIIAVFLLILACSALNAAHAITPNEIDWDSAEESVPGGTLIAFLAVSWTAMIATIFGIMLAFPALIILLVLACRTHGRWRIAMWCAVAGAVLAFILALSLP